MSPPAENLRGAGLMALGMACFTLSDACMKALGEGMPLAQSITVRGLAVAALTGAAVVALGTWRGVGRRAWGLVALRGAAEAGAAWLFFSALLAMPLANLSAVMQASPLVLALAAWPALGQRPGPVRLWAIAAGLCGVLLIVRPGAEGWGWPVLQALGSILFVTLRDLASRRLATGAPNSLVVAATAAAVALSGVAAVPWGGDWVAVGPREAALLAGTALFVTGGYAGGAAAMRAGDVAFVAPFRYAGLLVAILVGVLAFGAWPDVLTLLGAGVVTGAGLVMLWRERRAARARAGRPLAARAGPPP